MYYTFKSNGSCSINYSDPDSYYAEQNTVEYNYTYDDNSKILTLYWYEEYGSQKHYADIEYTVIWETNDRIILRFSEGSSNYDNVLVRQ